MLAQVWSAALRGVDSFLVRVEVNVSAGLPTFSVVGLPHGSVREGRDRVLTALKHHGMAVPPKRVVVNLAPADVKKEGSALDLPIALGLLTGSGHVTRDELDGWAFVGELGLDGSLRPVRGALSLAEGCRRAGLEAIAVPRENAAEAAVVDGIRVVGIADLPQMLAVLRGGPVEVPEPPPVRPEPPTGVLEDVRGQELAKRALEVAAAGGHHVLFIGPPGVGKTMLARRLPGILPPMSREDAIEVTRIHSVAGVLGPGAGLVSRRPFRAPHHTVSGAGLLGGGTPPRPGELSLAHRGVLFLDELAEFPRHVLDGLRQPLEEGVVRLARARHTVTFPSRIQLAAAMNPCPCGYFGDGSDRCTCDPTRVVTYRSRASGPLLDRIDLQVHVVQPPASVLADPRDDPTGPTTERVAACCRAARARQRDRYGPDAARRTNADVAVKTLMGSLDLAPDARHLVTSALTRLRMSARAYHRVLRVSRTIADLEGDERVQRRHVAEALQYRALDRAVR